MFIRPIHIVWFKRDLRASDHTVLATAAARGPVLALYIVEPALWREPDASGRQYAFLTECLRDLRRDLAAIGLPLVIRVGDAPQVLATIASEHAVGGLWSHEETGNGWTFARDKAVAAWCRANAVAWTELPQNGVIRRLATRNGWARKWDDLMARPLIEVPHGVHCVGHVGSDDLPGARDLGIADDPCPGRQPGGRRAAIATLDSFLDTRGRDYRFSMSSPVSAFDACSRLSPHLAFGTLSMREVANATRARFQDLALAGRELDTDAWKKSLVSFTGRLHWHCHFMQKLESQPGLEFSNLHRAYDGLRPETPDGARLTAWARGETGFPFVDACMRALNGTGWLNFRMRAMLVSFASYQLWLPWRDTGLHLARQFTDYEPGIHWPQVQMQSGTTGINTVRMYNPVKQGYDQDPTGLFVRRWVPELAQLPDSAIHEPWRFSEYHGELKTAYPARIVDHVAAAKVARDAVWGVRGNRQFRDTADAIQDQHGSRKSGMPHTGQRTRGQKSPRTPKSQTAVGGPKPQLEFDL